MVAVIIITVIVITTIMMLSVIDHNILVTNLEEVMLPLFQFGTFSNNITWTPSYNPELSWPSTHLSFVDRPLPLLTQPGVILPSLLETVHGHHEPVLSDVPNAPLYFLPLLAKALVPDSEGKHWISPERRSESQPGQSGLSAGWEPELALPVGTRAFRNEAIPLSAGEDPQGVPSPQCCMKQ